MIAYVERTLPFISKFLLYNEVYQFSMVSKLLKNAIDFIEEVNIFNFNSMNINLLKKNPRLCSVLILNAQECGFDIFQELPCLSSLTVINWKVKEFFENSYIVLNRLQSLNLQDITCSNDFTQRILSNCPNLRFLCLERFLNLKDDALNTSLKSLRSLTELRLGKLFSIKNISSIFECVFLTKLIVNHCPNFRKLKSSFSSITMSNYSLRYIDISWTDCQKNNIIDLLKFCLSLNTLIASNCGGVSGTLKVISASLKTLHLDSCDQLQNLMISCDLLSNLNLHLSHNIKSLELQSLQMTDLQLRSMSRLKQLRLDCPALRSLDVRGWQADSFLSSSGCSKLVRIHR